MLDYRREMRAIRNLLVRSRPGIERTSDGLQKAEVSMSFLPRRCQNGAGLWMGQHLEHQHHRERIDNTV